MVWAKRHTLAALYPRERCGTHCTGGWVGPRAGMDVCWKCRLHRDSIPGQSSSASIRYTEYATRPTERELYVILILDAIGSHKSPWAVKFFHANEIWWSFKQKWTADAGCGRLTPPVPGDEQIRDKTSRRTYQRLCMRIKKYPTSGASFTQHNEWSATGSLFATRSWHHQR